MDRRAELEAAIDADPYDTRVYAVYGDYLQELGDPRGDLIALHVAKAADPDRRLDTATRELFGRHPTLLPPNDAQQLRWKCGFVRRAELPASSVPSLLAHPSSRFLVELAVYWSKELDSAIDALSAHVRPALRDLAIGADRSPVDAELDLIGWPDTISSLGPIWPCLPHLRRLRILGGNPALGDLDLPNLVELELRTTLVEPHITAVAAADWPQLERLDLGLEMVASPVLAQLRRLLLEAPPPRLLHFGLRGARRLLFDAIADPRDLAAALGRLRSLDLARNLLHDDDVRLLVGSGIRLERLDVSRNQLTTDAIASLAAISTTVIADDQHELDDDPIEDLYDY